MFRVSRKVDDGRVFYKGYRFIDNQFETDSQDVANSAMEQGWKVESVSKESNVVIDKEIVPEVPKEFVCDICGKVFDKNVGLSSHKRFGHKE